MTCVDGIKSVAQLAAGLRCLEAPANLYVDGFWDDSVDRFYAEFPPQIAVVEVEVGILWPTPRIKHFSITDESLKGLCVLAKRHASIELFSNFTAYNENGLLLQGYDFPGDEIEVFGAMPRSMLTRFCELSRGTVVERDE
jgi:hypothetical protein